MLIQKILSTHSYIVIDRSKIKAILTEKELYHSGVVEPDQKLVAGKLLGADKLLTGSIVVKGKNAYITLKSIDIDSGVIDYSEVYKISPDIDLAKFIEKRLKKLGVMNGRRMKRLR